MNRYLVYSTLDGSIIKIITTYSNINQKLKSNEKAVINSNTDINDVTHYIDLSNETVIEKSILPVTQNKQTILADGIDEIIFFNFPSGVTVKWPDKVKTTEENNEIIFSVDLEGTYTFLFSLFPYLDKEITVEAIPAT